MKWKNILVDVKDVAQKAFCGSISLSMLNVIKNQQFTEYIIKRLGDKCACCIACEKNKAFETPIESARKSHSTHQRKYIEHVDNHEAHHQNHCKNYALSIMRPNKVLKIIHNTMDHAKTNCPCYTCKIKATDGLFKFPIVILGL